MRVSSAEFKANYESITGQAMLEPVTITGDGKSLTLVSTEEFERLRRGDRKVILTRDATDADIRLVEQSRMSSEHDHLNAELSDWTP